ncbi:MAG TPA: T9SS type A sorting domain-containing protein, partial [Bacteroidia bacterium]|nr:T9SS type A sorting domain-containing protein [Bacteroidia bacterium]
AIADASMMGIHDAGSVSLAPLELFQNSPNPFQEGTLIHFNLSGRETVNLYVSDMLGHKVATLYEHQPMDKGGHDYVFNAHTAGLKKGVYQYTLESDSSRVTRKMTVTE